MRIPVTVSAATLTLALFAGNAHAQIKPESSGKPSLSEPEPNPRGEGDYRPNEPAQPEVGATARRGASSAFENQIHKGSDPSANGK